MNLLDKLGLSASAAPFVAAFTLGGVVIIALIVGLYLRRVFARVTTPRSVSQVLADVGAWWLAKLSAALAPVVILGGVTLAVANAALILLPLYELWIKKE